MCYSCFSFTSCNQPKQVLFIGQQLLLCISVLCRMCPLGSKPLLCSMSVGICFSTPCQLQFIINFRYKGACVQAPITTNPTQAPITTNPPGPVVNQSTKVVDPGIPGIVLIIM